MRTKFCESCGVLMVLPIDSPRAYCQPCIDALAHAPDTPDDQLPQLPPVRTQPLVSALEIELRQRPRTLDGWRKWWQSTKPTRLQLAFIALREEREEQAATLRAHRGRAAARSSPRLIAGAGRSSALS